MKYSKRNVRRMNQRQRKKHEVAEFAVFGFCVSIRVDDEDKREQITDSLIELVESIGVGVVAGNEEDSPADQLDCSFWPMEIRSLEDAHRDRILHWFSAQRLFIIATSDLYDLHDYNNVVMVPS